MMQNKITSTVSFTQQDIHPKDWNTYLQDFYKENSLNYPKYFKMDNLSKLGIIAMEKLLQQKNLLANYLPEDIGLILMCKNASTDSDLKYWESAQTVSSPALFVYTLPNVMLGEICIKYGIKGENTCFVFDIFDKNFLENYTHQLLENKDCKCCITGWIDFFDDKFDVNFWLVERIKE